MRRRSHSTSAPGPRCAVDGGRVQRLRDVPQVGEPPLAVGAREQAARAASVSVVTASSSAATPRSCSTDCPAPDGGAQLVEQGVGPRPAQLLDGVAEEARERRGAQPGQPRLLQRLQQREPVGATGAPKTLAVPVTTAGTPRAAERRAHRARPGRWCAPAPRRRRGAPAMPSIVARLPSRRGHVGGQVARDQLARRARRSASRAAAASAAPPGWRPAPAPACPRAPRPAAVRPARPSTGCTTIRSSPSAAPAEHRVQRVEQRRVAAVVDRERGVVVGRRGWRRGR